MTKLKANEVICKNLKRTASQICYGTREVEVNFYMDHYLEKFSQAAHYTKCKKSFKKLSNNEKLAYLGIGDCTSTEKAEQTILNNKSYHYNGAKRIYEEMKKGIPVCE